MDGYFCAFQESQGGGPRGNLGFHLASDANPETKRLSEDAQSEGK